MKKWYGVSGAAAAALMSLAVPGQAAAATVCFPTCVVTDNRFLVEPSGTGADTFQQSGTLIQFSGPLEIFDADSSADWDDGAVPTSFQIYTDVNGNGLIDGPDALVATLVGAPAHNNVWTSGTAFTPAFVPTPGQFYTLQVASTLPATFTWNAYKLRTDGQLSPRAFAFLGALDLAGNAPTYDGTWDFFAAVPAGLTEVKIFDGDFDLGSCNGPGGASAAPQDTNDPNSSGIPPFSGPGAVPEGVTTGQVCPGGGSSTGAPADDNNDPRYRRSPSVVYSLRDPDGRVYLNDNPSGNVEWEAFTIRLTSAGCVTTGINANADFCASVIPGGVWQVRMVGMDLGNLNYWHFDFPLLGSTQTFCQAGPNPSGNIPNSGYLGKEATGKGKPNYGGHQRPDGFYKIGSLNAGDVCVVDGDNLAGPFFGPYPTTTNVKYTEANGAKPSAKKMGGGNSAVEAHIKGQGDMGVYAATPKAGGGFSCLAPPPPPNLVICYVPPFPTSPENAAGGKKKK